MDVHTESKASEGEIVTGGTRVLGYVRVSTLDQAESGAGLDAQEASIRAECERRGWALLEVLRDEGLSGKGLERPGLRTALEVIARGEARASL